MQLHRHPKQCYNMLKYLDDAGRNFWATKTKTPLYKYGLIFIWINQDFGDVNAFIRMLKHRVDNYSTLDREAAIDTSSRCGYYFFFKSTYCCKIIDYIIVYMYINYI